MNSAKPRITVAICTRNRARFLEKAMQSIVPQLTAEDELLIIDNASSDNTAEITKEFSDKCPQIRVHREAALGIAFARNAAMRHANGDWLLFLDDDETASPQWLQAYRSFFERHVGGRIGAVGGGCIPEYESAPPAWHNQERDRYDLGEEELVIPHEVPPPGAGNCAFSRIVTTELGGFSTDLKRAEDTDMHQRMQKAGYEIWWLPEAPIYHFMPRERLTLSRMAKAAFVDGRACGRVRLRQRNGVAAREAYRIGRILFSAPYVLYYVVLALLTIPVRGGRLAARSFQRAMRAAGMGWQMVADLPMVSFENAI
jgi:glycosyltransferase involved in cell wall biosynthesis